MITVRISDNQISDLFVMLLTPKMTQIALHFLQKCWLNPGGRLIDIANFNMQGAGRWVGVGQGCVANASKVINFSSYHLHGVEFVVGMVHVCVVVCHIKRRISAQDLIFSLYINYIQLISAITFDSISSAHIHVVFVWNTALSIRICAWVAYCEVGTFRCQHHNRPIN